MNSQNIYTVTGNQKVICYGCNIWLMLSFTNLLVYFTWGHKYIKKL